MRRRYVILSLTLVAAISLAWPAAGASPLSRIRKLERQVRALTGQALLHDEVRTSTATAQVFFQGTYGSATAYCPPGSTVTGGGVQWSGTFGTESGVYFSQPSGNGWSVGVKGGAGTSGAAFAVAVCTRLG